MNTRKILFFLISLFVTHFVLAGTTGKIAGTITDARTGEKLVSANVTLEDTRTGASTNIEGYYVLLNIPPGNYRLKASLLGYTPSTVTNVRVDIDQTTTIDIQLNEESVQAEEVIVVAQRPVVQKDVSNSRANISPVEVEKLPVATVAGVVGLQAGIETTGEGQFVIRGGAAAQTNFMVNGQSLRDARDNRPYTGISLTSIENIQIQTGGFNAEYGNVRSGLVNVVTKEGSKSAYSFAFIGRYSPARQKHFGAGPYDPNAYWVRPYIDPAVAFTGTNNGVWDDHTKRQYPEFEGWNAVSARTLQNTDPNDDLTPEAARQLFLFQHRKKIAITNSDYDVDMSFGGPVPFISDQLGGLRFFASYRQARNMYLFPLSDDALRDYNGQLKITSDLGDGMKLAIEGLISKSTGTSDNNTGNSGVFTTPGDLSENGYNYTIGSYRDAALFGYDYWAPTAIRRNMVGAKFTHVVSPSTYYDASLHRFETKYETNPGQARDSSRIYRFGNAFYVDEAPFGFPLYQSGDGIGSRMNMSLGWAGSRDSSMTATYNLKFAITSQLDQYNQAQAGVEFIYTDNDVIYAQRDLRLTANNSRSAWHTFPKQGAVYVQDKIEFEGMIANVGLRLDYSHAGSNWFANYNPYDPRFGDIRSLGLDSLLTEPTKKIVTLSPRLGVAFPISTDSKIFFNYGHFRDLPVPEDLFLIRRFTATYSISRLANPNNALPKTVSYELGYEQNIFDEFLLRVAGYYKDVTDETRLVRYTSSSNQVNYTVSTNNTYRDIRGAEITASRNRGSWVQGFINYTYDVRTNGYFGYGRYYEDRVQQRVEIIDKNVYQEKPLPQPFARMNLDFFTPENIGPEFLGQSLLGDWRVNFVASWRSGGYFTWGGPGGKPGVADNVQWTDSYNVNMRVSKNFRVSRANIQLFMDVNNLFNFKQMSKQLGFANRQDYEDYLTSLHLPADIAGDENDQKLGYRNFPGDDRPGDYRTVPYEPYEPNDPDPAHRQYVLDNKAYIDMPNQEYLAFLNPRDVYFGVRMSFDF